MTYKLEMEQEDRLIKTESLAYIHKAGAGYELKLSRRF